MAEKVAEAKEGLHEKVKELEKEEEDRVSFEFVDCDHYLCLILDTT